MKSEKRTVKNEKHYLNGFLGCERCVRGMSFILALAISEFSVTSVAN